MALTRPDLSHPPFFQEGDKQGLAMLDVSSLPTKAPEYDLEALLEAGCHFGHQKHKWHPKMKPFIYVEKDGVHIFDLAKTASQLQQAYNFAFQLGKEGKTLIFVGTKRQAREVVKEGAASAGLLSITTRWLGGLLTNWEQVRLSIKRMVEIEEGLKNDKFKGYTKYERGQIEKELGRLLRFFDGIRNLKTKPDCLFIVDPVKEKNALAEAIKMDVPVIALADSNADPSKIDVVVPANDDAVRSVKLIVDQIAAGYKAGRDSK